MAEASAGEESRGMVSAPAVSASTAGQSSSANAVDSRVGGCKCFALLFVFAAVGVGIAVSMIARHLTLYGSLFVPDPTTQPWPGEIRVMKSLDILQRPGCFSLLLTPVASRRYPVPPSVSASCPQALVGGMGGVLDLLAPFLLRGGLGQWVRRWSQALKVIAEAAGDVRVNLQGKPVEQGPGGYFKAKLSEFAMQLHQWPATSAPPRPLYLAEAKLIRWLRGLAGKPVVTCPDLVDTKEHMSKCQTISEFLFQEFGWVEQVLGNDINEVETDLWAGPAGARSGLHADIEPFNLLAVLSGKKRVTLWPPHLSSSMYVSKRYDDSAIVGDVDVFAADVAQRWPDFEAIRDHNMTVVMSAGDVIHIPPGWWHVAENLETSVAVTFHIWHWTWSEQLRWLPHQVLSRLHDLDIYKSGEGQCTEPRCNTKHSEVLPEPLNLHDAMQAGTSETTRQVCSASGVCTAARAADIGTAPAGASGRVIEGDSRRPPGHPEWVLLHAAQSDFQALSVWQSVQEDSIYLLLDNDVQLTSKGEYVYHEMMAFVPLSAVECARSDVAASSAQQADVADAEGLRVFVFGAGDAGVVQRLLQHSAVVHVQQVEIDALVLNISRKFFPQIQPESGPRYSVTVGDGVAFARRAARGSLAGTFDLVLLDTTDALVAEPSTPATVTPAPGSPPPGRGFFTPELYADLAAMLKPNGVLVQNIQSLDQLSEVRRMDEIISTAFPTIVPYSIATPDYISPYFAFLASKGPLRCPQRRECARMLNISGQEPRFWNEGVHEAAFALPPTLVDLGRGSLEACGRLRP